MIKSCLKLDLSEKASTKSFLLVSSMHFGDYDDIRAMTIEEMKKMEESPTFSGEGTFIAE